MKSIRWSLVFYFVLLEAVALGAAFMFVHRSAGQSLGAEHDAYQKLLSAQFKDNVDEEGRRLDNELLSQARILAQLTAVQMQLRPIDVTQLLPLGLLTSSLEPQGHMTAYVWAASGGRTPLHTSILRRMPTEFFVNEDMLPRDGELTGEEYFQINSEFRSVWRSKNLGDTFLLYDQSKFSNQKAVDWLFDDTELPSGRIGRRVQLKLPVARTRLVRSPQAPLPPLPTDEPPGSRGPRFEFLSRWIVVQCACATDHRDAALARLSAELTQKRYEIFDEAEASLGELRARFYWIGLLTFAATVLGGSVLVSVGLEPLRRLSDAVSRVNPKDFHLPVSDRQLPLELSPIAGRLRQTLDELRRAFEREKQASADISHELRTPVAALLATLDVALRKPRTADEYRKTLVESRAITAGMRMLVERLLALARLDAGAARLRHESIDVSVLVAQTLALVRPLAAVSELTLTAAGPPGLAWVSDPDKLREVLVNLLHNAVQYNRPGGSINVATGVVGGELEVTVTDTGVGIATEAIDHIFERFYRVDPSREASEFSAGLGLSIVRGYVELLGGTIAVTSQLGTGTTFRVRLPQLTAEGRAAA